MKRFLTFLFKKIRKTRNKPRTPKTYRSLLPGSLGINRMGHVIQKQADGSHRRMNKPMSKKFLNRAHAQFLAEAKQRGVEVDPDELRAELKSFTSRGQVKALLEYCAD